MGEPTTATELEELRERHKVKPMDEAAEGLSLERLPRGVYGFAYALGQESTPVFRKHSYQSFEVHKLPDGAEHLVGFVSPKHAREIGSRGRDVEITVYPEPWGEANRLVSLLLDEILPSNKGPSRVDGNYLRVRLL